MKILVWRGKHGNGYFDATDEYKALKFLFLIINTEYHYYNPENMSPADTVLYKKALDGDKVSLVRFMQTRYDHEYEYEEWEFEDIYTEEDFTKKFGEDVYL